MTPENQKGQERETRFNEIPDEGTSSVLVPSWRSVK